MSAHKIWLYKLGQNSSDYQGSAIYHLTMICFSTQKRGFRGFKKELRPRTEKSNKKEIQMLAWVVRYPSNLLDIAFKIVLIKYYL